MHRDFFQNTIIIPTACTTNRAESLFNAINSIQQADPETTRILVAANGPNIDPALEKQLKKRRDIVYVSFEDGSLPKTIALAVPLVKTEFFGFLDDDDELLPNALLQRRDILLSHPDASLVISNGYIRKEGKDSIYLSRMATIPEDPLGALMRENWLPSCGALFRTARVGPAYFHNYHRYAEWTWLAFRLALDRQTICVLDAPTFRVNADTPSSLSKSAEYRQSYISLYRKMLALRPPYRIRRALRKRILQAYHDASSQALGRGRTLDAFRDHLRSLAGLHGLRFLPYSRHILGRFLRAADRSNSKQP